MNRTAFENTIKLMEQEKEHFDMRDFFITPDGTESTYLFDETPISEEFHTCGASACLAGYMVMANQPDCPLNKLIETALEISGLTEKEFNFLYCGDWTRKRFSQTTPEMGIEYLRKALAENNPMVRID